MQSIDRLHTRDETHAKIYFMANANAADPFFCDFKLQATFHVAKYSR